MKLSLKLEDHYCIGTLNSDSVTYIRAGKMRWNCIEKPPAYPGFNNPKEGTFKAL